MYNRIVYDRDSELLSTPSRTFTVGCVGCVRPWGSGVGALVCGPGLVRMAR